MATKSGDSLGELKIGVSVEVDAGKARAANQTAANESQNVWQRAAQRVEERQTQAAQHGAQAQRVAATGATNAWQDAAGSIARHLAAAFAAGKVRDYISGVYDSALAIDRQARSLGVSTDEIQRLRYVAEQAGLEGNDLGEAMGGLAQRVQAAADAGGDARKHFDDLGIAITDANGATLPANELLANAADALQRMGPGTAQTAAAMQLFGEKGRLLLPVLSQGRAGIESMGAEFDALGGGLDEETIESVRRTDRELARLRVTVVDGLMRPIRGLIDAMRGASERFRGFFRDVRAAFNDGDRLNVIIATLGTATTVLAGAFAFAKREAISAGLAAARAWLAAAWPVALVLAGIVGLGLVVDDFLVTLDGGDSVIRRFLTGLFGAKDAEAIIDNLRTTADNIAAAFDAAVANVGLFKTVATQAASDVYTALGPLQVLADAIASAFESMADHIGDVLPIVGRIIGGPLGAGIIDLGQAAARTPASTSRGAAETARNANAALERARSGGPLANTPDLLGGTGALLQAPGSLQATPSQAFRFGVSDQPAGGAVTATARAQVQINGVIDPNSTAFATAVEGAVENVMKRANDQAIEGVSKSRRRS